MNNIDERNSNSAIGMQSDELPEDVAGQETDSIDDSFFDELDQSVNGAVRHIEDEPEATQQYSGPEQATHVNDNAGSRQVDWDSDNNPYKKRYSDSSREAVKQRETYKELEPFVPVLEAMKNDSGLVDHVRNYLQNGGAPAPSVRAQLGLDEDFIFDTQEAMTEPESDSARVMQAHIDRMVQGRVGQMLQAEKENATKMNQQIQQANELKEFQSRKGMSDDEFEAFKADAQSHVLTLDDIDYLLNRDKAATNTANATRNEIANQMKNVRNMPASASGANNQGSNQRSPEDSLFDSLVSFDDNVDNLFG